MIQLTRHIEILLLSNDCVIVPGLGGFVTHRIDARYDENDCMFIPPLRTLGFNPQLQINDSLLAVSYVEAFDISYPEAVRMIESEVEEIKQTIATEGVFEMNNIGCLYLNKEGGYRFEPCEAGVLTPELYGLSSFEFDMLQAADAAVSADSGQPFAAQPVMEPREKRGLAVHVNEKAAEGATDGNGDDSGKFIHIDTAWIKNAMLAAAALFIAVMFITPRDTVNGYYSHMSTWSSELIQKLIPQDTNCETIKIQPLNITPQRAAEIQRKQAYAGVAGQDAGITGHDTAITGHDAGVAGHDAGITGHDAGADGAMQQSPAARETAANDDNGMEKAAANVAKKTQKEFYAIVLASSIPHKNAEVYTEQLKAKGFKDAAVYDNGNITRVIFGNFQSESNALDSLRKLRGNEDFKEAWVIKIG